jgi:hypothetical protein
MWNMAARAKADFPSLLLAIVAQPGKRKLTRPLPDENSERYHGAQAGQRVGARHARSAREEWAALRVAPLPPRKARRL